MTEFKDPSSDLTPSAHNPTPCVPTSPIAILNARKTLPKYRVTLTAPEVLAILDVCNSLSPSVALCLHTALDKARATIAGEVNSAPSYTPKARSTSSASSTSLNSLAGTSLSDLGEPPKSALWEQAYAKQKAGGELTPEEVVHRNEYLYLHELMHPEDVEAFESCAPSFKGVSAREREVLG